MHRPSIVLVTPALADANNGNWRTARRWAAFLSRAYRVRLTDAWHSGDADLMLALHARRSAASIQAWKAARPAAPLVVALTGTDLYRDIAHDAQARRSLDLADALVVLNRQGADALDPGLRAKVHTVLQSTRARRPAATKPQRHLRALMVGHLREEKDPGTFLRAAARLDRRADIRLDHVGDALSPSLGEAARATAAAHPRYRWLGGLSHERTLRRIRDAHVLVHCSRMEGGAHVVIEALCCGTPVIVSRIPGNLGLVGDDWPATFDVGDDAALARLIERARDEPAWLDGLARLAAERATAFGPAAEAAALQAVVTGCLAGRLAG